MVIGYTFGDDEPIVVAEPTNILRAWRLFVVDGRTSAALRYLSPRTSTGMLSA